MNSLPATNIHPKLQLYLQCSPCMDLNMRFLPHSGGIMEQNYEDVIYFAIIEERIKDILYRKSKTTSKK